MSEHVVFARRLQNKQGGIARSVWGWVQRGNEGVSGVGVQFMSGDRDIDNVQTDSKGRFQLVNALKDCQIPCGVKLLHITGNRSEVVPAQDKQIAEIYFYLPVEPPVISINRANTEELETLPEIGPDTARAIVEYRQANGPFRSAGDLDGAPGIGPVTVEEIRSVARV